MSDDTPFTHLFRPLKTILDALDLVLSGPSLLA
jgi:hypothetical protein